MDELLDGLDCRLRVSGMVADSIMMGIVNSAMEEAFQKACSKEGNIEQLNEKSRFCELAVMQLEWCLKFIQEETDSYVVVDGCSERENLISELRETRDRIQRRLQETEFAISEKDRELTERFEIELKLRQALEVKDRELWFLRSNLNELGRTKSEGIQDFVLSNKGGVDESIDGDFCELKNSVDQQFLNIKQKLEDERINFTSGIRKMSQGQSNMVNIEPDSQSAVDDEENFKDDEKRGDFYEKDCEFEPSICSLKPELNAGFHKMGSDIDALKETLDLAFGMMDNAISLSEVKPMEQQWRWSIEKETVAIVFRGYLRDIQDNLGAKVRGGKKQGSLALMENWSELMNEITSLRHELENLMDQVKTSNRRESMSPPSLKDVADKAFSRKTSPSRGKPPPEASSGSSALDRYGKPPNNTASKIKEPDPQEELSKEDSVGQGSLVAEMIKNHETFIRQKNAESNWLKVEILREKGCLSKKDMEPDTLKKRIQDIILRLDSIIKVNGDMDRGHDDGGYVHENDSVNSNLAEEIQLLKQEKEFSNLESMIQHELYDILFKCLVKEYRVELYKYGVENLIREDISKVFLSEMVKEWNEDLESYYVGSRLREDISHPVLSLAANEDLASYYVESHLREDISQPVLSLAAKDTHSFSLTEHQVDNNEEDFLNDSPLSNELLQNVEGQIKEDVHTVFLREMVKKWNEDLESYNIESHIRGEIYQIVFCEAVKDRRHGYNSTECQTERKENNFLEGSPSSNELSQILEGLIREDVYKVFLRKMVKEWNHAKENYNIESHIREDVDHIVFHETMKDISCTHSFISTECQRSRTQDNFVEDLSVNRLLSLEGKMKEDVHAVFLRNMDKKLKDLENYKNESLAEEEINKIVFNEVIKDMKDQVKLSNTNQLFQSLESLIREDVCKVVFREMVKEWNKEIESCNIESLISVQIYQIVIGEAFNDIHLCLTKRQEYENNENSTEEFPCTSKLIKDPEFHEKESLTQKLVSLSKCFELEEDLILSASYEFMERNTRIDCVNVDHERLEQWIHSEGILVQRESMGSVINKLEKALQQIIMSKAYLKELGSSLGIIVGDLDEVNDQITPSDATWLSSVFTTISKFSKETADFESMVQEKIGQNISRLEEVKYQLEPDVELVTSLRKRESLYRKAFMRRCYDLQKAETEVVDLLGDEVDALLILLEKIYRTLEHYSPVLQQNFDLQLFVDMAQIMEILKLIRKELSGPAACTSQGTITEQTAQKPHGAVLGGGDVGKCSCRGRAVVGPCPVGFSKLACLMVIGSIT
ncbi:hypothetical protein BVC80_1835g496 [Macleaya cordata]|uniref:WPP domain-associated protein n=1 Tax=Macleaya cordata TaxID=56857 RepID=A0A200R5W6_MACCD|nr:hypothetical protein BVC80_1835g496 [Macleaya cordata]